jgi:hypothetical protein
VSGTASSGRLFALSAAASVAAITMVITMVFWTALPGVPPELAVTAGALPATPIVTVAAGAGLSAQEPSLAGEANRFESYLLAHRPYSHLSGMQGIAPYARTVVENEREGAR